LKDLKTKSTSAVIWDYIGTLSTQGVGFGVSVVLSWLLDPAEFGLIGMALAFIAISQSFIDVGFASALIQSKKTTDLSYSSVFYVNIAIAAVLLVVFQFLAPVVATFYQEPKLDVVVRLLSVGMLISSLGIVQDTILQKGLRFKELAKRKVIAGVVSGVVGVVMAYQGFGVYALVAQQLTMSAVSTVLLWRISSWTPGLRFSFQELSKFWQFGSYVFLSGTLANIMSRLDVLIIGKLFSPTTLGFFTRAESLNNLVSRYTSDTIRKVFYPVLSSIQDDFPRFEKIFIKVLSVVSFLVFLLAGVMVLSGEFIIINLFGEKWQPSVIIFQILMLKIFTYPVNSIVLNSLLAAGKAKEIFWYDNVTRVLRVLGWVVAFKYGFIAYLWAIVVVNVLATFYYCFIVDRVIGIRFSKQMVAIYSFCGIFMISLLPAWMAKSQLSNGIFPTFFTVLSFVIIYITGVGLIKNKFSRMVFSEFQQLVKPFYKRITGAL
jgi:O-antigen/teichoic acid export membrane protein